MRCLNFSFACWLQGVLGISFYYAVGGSISFFLLHVWNALFQQNRTALSFEMDGRCFCFFVCVMGTFQYFGCRAPNF